jgi:hypothetical protein
MLMAFQNGRPPMTPAEAAEEHLTKTLERHPVSPPADLSKRRAINEVTEELKARRRRQSAHVEAEEVRAAECAQGSIEALEQELQLLRGDQRKGSDD